MVARAAGGDRQEQRLLEAKLAALADPELSRAVKPWLLGAADPVTALAELERLDRPLASYLAARARLSRGELAEALPLLRRAEAGPLPELLRTETRYLLAEANCLTGETAAGSREFAALSTGAEGGADLARAEVGERRCAFAAARK